MLKKIVIALISILLLLLPFLVDPYILQIFILTITYSMLGLAFALSLRVGLPRFDVAAWYSVGAYTTAILMKKAGLSFWITIFFGGIIAVIFGWAVFSIALRRGMIVFLMVGMVVTMILQQIYGSLRFFGGWGGTGVVPYPTLFSFKFVDKPELYYMGLFFLSLNLLIYYLLYNSRIGRAWNAIGSSTKLASTVGIDVFKYRMINVLIGNFFLALAGSYYVAYSLVAVPSAFSFVNSVFVMMYAVVGGLFHSLLGPIIGALIITFLPEYFRIAEEYAPIITSIIIIFILIFLPFGLLDLIDRRFKPIFAQVLKRKRKGQ